MKLSCALAARAAGAAPVRLPAAPVGRAAPLLGTVPLWGAAFL